MRLLLIGHGYLGQEIARVFRSEGWDVAAASRSGGDGEISCDVGDESSVEILPATDFIIHCASSGRGGPEAYQNVYVEGCRNLSRKFPGTPLIFVSSTSVYAQTDGSLVTENSPTFPERETGRLLLAAEQITLDAGGTVARLSGIYGPGRCVLLEKFLSGTAITEENGGRFLNQIHRDDAAQAIFHLANIRATGIFNVTDSTPLPQLACHAALAEIFHRSLPPTGPRDPTRKRGWTHKQVSNQKLLATGWLPRFPSFLDASESVARTLSC